MQEQLLESLYLNLGSRHLSGLVKTNIVPHQPRTSASPQAIALRQHVLERLTIFLAERKAKGDLNIESLSKKDNFKVQEVQHLTAKYTYQPGKKEYHHTEVSHHPLGEQDHLLIPDAVCDRFSREQ